MTCQNLQTAKITNIFLILIHRARCTTKYGMKRIRGAGEVMPQRLCPESRFAESQFAENRRNLLIS